MHHAALQRVRSPLYGIMFWTAFAVYRVVVGLLLYAIVRGYRQRHSDAPRCLPETLVVTALAGQALYAASRQLTPTIEIVGHQFWWEVRYPDQQLSTVNEIHIPVGERVELLLTSPGKHHE